MSVVVRDARPDEYAALGELLADAYREYVPTWYLEVVGDVGSRAAASGATILAARDPLTGELVGAATFTLPGSELLDALPPGVATDDARHAGMRMMAVAKAARGRGVGAALVGECVARARLAGLEELAFVTQDTMIEARRLYERLGFTPAPERDKQVPSVGRLPAYVLPLMPWPLVRAARPDEYAAAGELTAQAYLVDGYLTPDDDYAAELRDARDRADRARLLVAVDRSGGAVVGTVTMCPVGSPYREIGRDDEGEFRMLAVSARARGNGVGEALVRSVLARAHADGMAGVAMSSLDQMRTAHRLYERLGFSRDRGRDWRPAHGVELWAFAREV
jgi:ribosomal protein S18 acetylase RimI-like enzyme